MRPLGVATLKIEVTGEITAELANLVARAVATYPSHSIDVDIDTGGGRWDATLCIFKNLEGHARRVTTHIRAAASGGALIALAGDIRQMHPDGHFFLHWPTTAYGATSGFDEAANTKAKLMAGCCRVPAARFLRWMKSNTVLPAKRCLEVGLVHAVPGLTRPKLPTVFLD